MHFTSTFLDSDCTFCQRRPHGSAELRADPLGRRLLATCRYLRSSR